MAIIKQYHADTDDKVKISLILNVLFHLIVS